jgi:uncharacterized membrane protein YtjA (UPF0391 family)
LGSSFFQDAFAADRCMGQKNKEVVMLNWAVTFLVVALIAGVLGFTGIAGAASQIAWILFVVFIVLFLVSLIAGRGRGPLV